MYSLERPKVGPLSLFALRAPLSPTLDVLSLLDGSGPSPIDVHYIVVRHVIMNNSYVLPVLLALVHDRLKRLWNVVEHRHVQTFTSYVHTHTLSSSCIRLCLLLPLSYFHFRSIPSLYGSMFILNLVQHLACRCALTTNCTTNDPHRSQFSEPGNVSSSVGTLQRIYRQLMYTHARRTLGYIEHGSGRKRTARRVIVESTIGGGGTKHKDMGNG